MAPPTEDQIFTTQACRGVVLHLTLDTNTRQLLGETDTCSDHEMSFFSDVTHSYPLYFTKDS